MTPDFEVIKRRVAVMEAESRLRDAQAALAYRRREIEIDTRLAKLENQGIHDHGQLHNSPSERVGSAGGGVGPHVEADSSVRLSFESVRKKGLVFFDAFKHRLKDPSWAEIGHVRPPWALFAGRTVGRSIRPVGGSGFVRAWSSVPPPDSGGAS